ncbi:MAG: lipopolysaccharide heptosyltransferase I [Betaproteobacteria bacterium]
MPAILLVKTSSMGDVVHNLPVVEDILAARPDARIDWLVEEAFAAIPRLHHRVRQVIPVAIRRWRKRLFAKDTRSAFGDFLQALRRERYDAIIDSQGLLKSAILGRIAHGRRHGLDWKSSREPLRLFYERTYSIPWSLHAVERNRLLAAQALNYPLANKLDYGISPRTEDVARLATQLPGGFLDQPFAMLLHVTSDAAKEWPEQRWTQLGAQLADRGIRSILPFGSDTERLRSNRLAALIRGAVVPPRLDLGPLAALLSHAQVAVGVDTGLTHLAVALGRPSIGLYCATDPAATGLYGSPVAVALGRTGYAPSVEEVVAEVQRLRSVA